ncbi:MAG: glycosyltransferase [Meiothermus sp.]|nr:glycosyltransferase [Meiothermus sp.]
MKATIYGANLPSSIHGGAEVYAGKLAKALEAVGFTVSFALPTYRPQDCDLLILNGSQGTVALWADAWVNRARAVWIIPHDSIRTYARNNGWYWRRPVDEVFHHLLKAKFAQLLSRGARLIAVSHANAAEMRQDFGLDPVLIPNGVDYQSPQFTAALDSVTRFKARFGLLGGFVARWDVTKNPDAVQQMAQQIPPEAGLVIRSSPDGIYAMRPWPPFQHPQVLWLGSLERPELYGLYSLLDFLLLPSRYEGFGYVSLEAASAGAVPFVTPTGLGKLFAQTPALQPLVMNIAPFGSETPQTIWPRILSLSNPAIRQGFQQALQPVVQEHRIEHWVAQIQRLALESVGTRAGSP